MTDENLRALLEKSSDADLLREMVGFAARRLLKLEVETAPGMASAIPRGSTTATAIAIACGRRARAPSSCASRSCAREANISPD